MTSEADFITLARLAARGQRHDVIAFLRRVAARTAKGSASTSASIAEILEFEDGSPMRIAGALPVDLDSRFELLRVTQPQSQPKPILSHENDELLSQILRERNSIAALHEAGLLPTRSILFTGPPGLGKTLSAKWLASELGLPLMVLDLSSVMSSLLGKSGGNLRAVIDYAKSEHGILFLDEFDSVAKRRNDAVDIGELKRLVTVLLQEIDLWPHDKLLIAATNHEDLLDPAIWRRFDIHLRFTLPDNDQLVLALDRFLAFDPPARRFAELAVNAFSGKSFSDIEREITRLRKQSLLTETDFAKLLQSSVLGYCKSLRPRDRKKIALDMCNNGISISVAHEWTGTARDTIRSGLEEEGQLNG